MERKISPRIYRITFASVAMLVLGLATALAQNNSNNKANSDSPAGARMRTLNNSLLALHGQIQAASLSDARLLHAQAATVIAQRAAALSTLIQRDPHAALTFAFSSELVADLAEKFPQSASQLESHATVTGPVQHWVADDVGLKSSRSWWLMKSGGQNLYLYFAGQEPSGLRSNQVLQVSGVAVGPLMAVETATIVTSSSASNVNRNPLIPAQRTRPRGPWPVLAMFMCGLAIVLPSSSRKTTPRQRCNSIAKNFAISVVLFSFVASSMPAVAQNSCSTKGVQNTAILLINFSDVATTMDAASANTDFFDTATGRSLNGYWQEASYGQTSAAGNVFGPFTIGPSTSYTCAVFQQLSTDVLSVALAGGVNLQNYSRIFVILPALSCGWIGLTSSGSAGGGCTTWATPAGTVTASLSFVADSYMMTTYYPWTNARDGAVALVAHEGGHQLGLVHSGTIDQRPTAVLEPPDTAGHITDQGDEFTVMGSHNLGIYQAQQKATVLGWMNSPSNYQTVTSNGTFTLQPIETSPAGLQALRIQRGSNSGYYLWAEYKQPLGQYDSTLANPPLSNQPFTGAMVTYEDPYYEGVGQVPGHTYLADFNLADTYWEAPDLNPGQTWTDPYTNVSLSVLGATSSGLTLAVNYGTAACLSAAPSVNVSPSNPSIYPGQSAAYTVSVTDNDSAACSSSTMNVGSATPSGWSTSLSASSIVLTPGQSASVTMNKVAPVGTPAGTYPVNLTASGNSFSSSGTANATVMTTPSTTVTVSVSGNSFPVPGTVPITAAVTNGGVPASGATVTLTVTSPSGAKSIQSATTGSSGTATWNYKLNGKSVAGTYTVSAQATLSSGGTRKNASTTQSVTSNPATFIVQ